jgi:PTS system fructose-specific IIC component
VLAGFPDLTPYLAPERVLHLTGSPSKRDALLALGAAVSKHPHVTNPAAWLKAVFDREDVGSTGVGGGIAVPHAQHPTVTDFVIGLGLCHEGMDFAAKDGRPVHVLTMIAAPVGDRPTYLKVLASVAARLNRAGAVQAMLAARDPTHMLGVFLGR